MVFFRENVFPFYFWGFFRQKLEKNSKIGKVRNYDEETEYFEKKKTLSSF